MIPAEKWKWFGLPGHFIAAASCRHHLCTQIGRKLISTVGEYHPGNRGDSKRETIGCDRYFETFVFNIGKGKCSCGCGLPEIIPSEIDSLPANDAKTADANHMKLCRKYASLVTSRHSGGQS